MGILALVPLNKVCNLCWIALLESLIPAPTPCVRVSAAAGPGVGKVGADPGAPADCPKLGVAVGAGTACVPEIARVGALVPDVGAATAGLAFVGVVVAAAA